MYKIHVYLSLCLSAGWTVRAKQISPCEVSLSDLSSLQVPQVTVPGGDSPESFDLHPTHEVFSRFVLIEKQLQNMNIHVRTYIYIYRG